MYDVIIKANGELKVLGPFDKKAAALVGMRSAPIAALARDGTVIEISPGTPRSQEAALEARAQELFVERQRAVRTHDAPARNTTASPADTRATDATEQLTSPTRTPSTDPPTEAVIPPATTRGDASTSASEAPSGESRETPRDAIKCAGAGCTHMAGRVRVDTRAELIPFCPRCRKRVWHAARAAGRDLTIAASQISAGYSAATEASSRAKRTSPTLSFAELIRLAQCLHSSEDVDLHVGPHRVRAVASGGAVLFDEPVPPGEDILPVIASVLVQAIERALPAHERELVTQERALAVRRAELVGVRSTLQRLQMGATS